LYALIRDALDTGTGTDFAGYLANIIEYTMYRYTVHCTVGWVDIGTRTGVPLRFVTYLSKIMKINEKGVLIQ
jgi:hypothetical protein